MADRGEECGEYLNARVNSEVGASGASSEADELLASFTSEMVDSDGCKLSMTAESGGGFRVRAPQELVREILEERVLAAIMSTARAGHSCLLVPRQLRGLRFSGS